MKQHKCQGNATVELVLIAPIFLVILAFGGIAGGYARLMSHGSSAADDMLRFSDGLDSVGLAAARGAESTLTPAEITRQWDVQNPGGEITTTVTSLESETDGMSAWNPTNQTNMANAFTDDHLGFDEEIQRMLLEGLVAYNDNFGNVQFVTRSTPATAWYNAHGDNLELDGSVEMLEDRSGHRMISMEMSSQPWLRTIIPGGDIFNATFNVWARRRMRPITGIPAWHLFDDAGTFHADLEQFLIDMGETTATLTPTPYWSLHQSFLSPN